jgi:hypothetical protein
MVQNSLKATGTNHAQGCASVEWFLEFKRIDFPRVGMGKGVWAVWRMVEEPVHAG